MTRSRKFDIAAVAVGIFIGGGGTVLAVDLAASAPAPLFAPHTAPVPAHLSESWHSGPGLIVTHATGPLVYSWNAVEAGGGQ